MAATVEAGRLTEVHRRAQIRIGAGVVQAMQSVWPLLNVDDLDGSFERWLRATTTIVGGQRVASARLAANYVQTFKTLELGAGAAAAPIVLAETVPADQIATSMLVVGPVAVKSALGRGVPPVKAMEIASARTSAAAMRHTLNGGRDTITGTVNADPQASRWRRVTSGNACDFCSMLAGRGTVYQSGTVTFQAHDGCGCTAEPVYR
jgi:hypothetical protein